MNLLERDERGIAVQLMGLSTPQTLTVNGSAGAATLSAAVGSRFARIHPTVDTFVLPTVASDVTSATGHFCAGGGCYDIPLGAGNTKISVLAVGTGAGVCYVSALG